jgi:hypothetical protein
MNPDNGRQQQAQNEHSKTDLLLKLKYQHLRRVYKTSKNIHQLNPIIS